MILFTGGGLDCVGLPSRRPVHVLGGVGRSKWKQSEDPEDFAVAHLEPSCRAKRGERAAKANVQETNKGSRELQARHRKRKFDDSYGYGEVIRRCGDGRLGICMQQICEASRLCLSQPRRQRDRHDNCMDGPGSVLRSPKVIQSPQKQRL